MINILLISHSENLAKETYHFINKMLPKNENANLLYIGGDDNGDFGNSYSKILTKLLELEKTGNQTLLFCDMGSAVMITQSVMEQENLNNDLFKIMNAPFVEGSFVAYSAITENNFDGVINMAEEKVKKTF